jgi:cytochrome oxidase Cu insertion factor (SCO1/SenC/PrrC family)
MICASSWPIVEKSDMSQIKRSLFILAISATAAIGTAQLAAAEDSSDLSGHPWIGEAAPDFDLETVGGDSLRLRDLRGKLIVLHFGASW